MMQLVNVKSWKVTYVIIICNVIFYYSNKYDKICIEVLKNNDI